MLRQSFLALRAAFAVIATAASAQTIVFTPNSTTFDPAGGNLSFTALITYVTPPSVLAFSTTLPTGWSYVSGTNEPPVKPSVGNTGTLSNRIRTVRFSVTRSNTNRRSGYSAR